MPLPLSAGHSASFDRSRLVTVSFGPRGTWDYGPVNPGVTATLRPANPQCLGSNGLLHIAPTPWAGPWLGEPFGLEVGGAPAGIPIISFGVTGLPPGVVIGGPGGLQCNVDILASVIEVPQSLATPYTTSFVMPNTPTLVGERLFCQAAYFDSGSPAA